MRVSEPVPRTVPGVTVRNGLRGLVYLLVLAVLTVVLANLVVSYRPVRGC